MATLGTLEYLISIDSSKLQSGLGQAENKVKGFGDKLSAWTVAKGNMIAQFAQKLIGTTVNVMKSTIKGAVEAYADYEQLVGGVDTLFKESSQLVQNNAANAYKRVGISANQYMETVTSFSASLLQSLGGDTRKAADVADMAMVDMADNVNKMGSSMESVENAYKGFAKQNYTMLDNLKLGYGGTKQEMQRLLKDAQKITGVKYDIKNLSDVYEAIHVIQQEMGITGTTEKEAMTTITGSLNAAKAAWQDVLVSIGSGKDVKKNIKKFAETAKTAIKNIKPVLKDAVSGLIEGAKYLLPEVWDIAVQLGKELVNGIGKQLFGEKWPVIVEWVQNGWEVLKLAFDTALKWIGKVFDVTIEWVQKAWETVSQAFADAGEWAGKTARTTVLWILEAWTAVSNAFADASEWVDGANRAIIEWVLTAWDAVSSAFTDAAEWAGKTYKTTINWVLTAWDAVSSAFADAWEWVGQTSTATIQWVQNAWNDVKDAIAQVSKGVWDNVVNFGLGAYRAVAAFINGLPKSIDIVVNFVRGTLANAAGGIVEAVTGSEATGNLATELFGAAWDTLWGHAKGSWNVPYDNYPSLLHRDEMVLTASQARQYREGGSSGTSEIVGALQSLRNDMQNMKLMVGRKVFGRAVVDYGGNRMNEYIGESDSRWAAGYGT